MSAGPLGQPAQPNHPVPCLRVAASGLGEVHPVHDDQQIRSGNQVGIEWSGLVVLQLYTQLPGDGLSPRVCRATDPGVESRRSGPVGQVGGLEAEERLGHGTAEYVAMADENDPALTRRGKVSGRIVGGGEKEQFEAGPWFGPSEILDQRAGQTWGAAI